MITGRIEHDPDNGIDVVFDGLAVLDVYDDEITFYVPLPYQAEKYLTPFDVARRIYRELYDALQCGLKGLEEGETVVVLWSGARFEYTRNGVHIVAGNAFVQQAIK